MAQVTITEALAETKTISARINSAQTAIQRHLVRDARMVDPLANVGGSEKFVAEQRQSIRDLQNRLVDIRTKIQDANRATSDRKSTRLNSSHVSESRMPSSA